MLLIGSSSTGWSSTPRSGCTTSSERPHSASGSTSRSTPSTTTPTACATTGAYVSYADVVEFVEALAASGDHVELVETWAEDVAAFALTNELAQAVRVTVQKLDIFDAADGVGISIERSR